MKMKRWWAVKEETNVVYQIKRKKIRGIFFLAHFFWLHSHSLEIICVGDVLRLKKQRGKNINKKEKLGRRKFDETFESEKTLLSI